MKPKETVYQKLWKYSPSLAENLLEGIEKEKRRKEKMDKMINATFIVRGTEKEIETIKARIAALSTKEEILSMYLKETLIS